MSGASVVAIYLHRTVAGPMEPIDEVCAEAGRGLVGDTYYQLSGTKTKPGADREVTLIESEALDGLSREHNIELDGSESRRNLVTRGVSLNPLVGREFRVGEVRLRGIRPCDPCKHLQSLTRPGVLKGLADRGGLRAQVLEGGTIRVGDPVSMMDA